MTRVKKVTSAKGRDMYYVDGKLTGKENMLPEVLELLENESEFDVDLGTEEKKCLFCADVPSRQKFLNGTTIELCENDYLTKTTGEVAAAMRNGG